LTPAKLYIIDPVKTAQAVHPTNILPSIRVQTWPSLSLMHVILRDGLADRAYVAQYTHGFCDLQKLAVDYPPALTAPRCRF
jgi:anaerobic selenocysteine-containing dehydrogenase